MFIEIILGTVEKIQDLFADRDFFSKKAVKTLPFESLRTCICTQ